MRAIVILQARQGSSRLPGKSLMPMGGRPMLQYTIELDRARGAACDVYLATSSRPGERCPACSSRVSAESLTSLATRAMWLRGMFRSSSGSRMRPLFPAVSAGTRPCTTTESSRRVSIAAETPGLQVITSLPNQGYPQGMNLEMIERDSTFLSRGTGTSRGRADFEHVTQYFYERLPAVPASARALRDPGFEYQRWKFSVDTRGGVRADDGAGRDAAPAVTNYPLEELCRLLEAQPAAHGSQRENRLTMFVISEISPQFGADLGVAEQMILQSKMGGADAVKVQLYPTELFFPDGDPYVKSRELDFDGFRRLYEYAERLGIPCSRRRSRRIALSGACRWDQRYFKVAARQHRENADLVRRILAVGRPTFVSVPHDMDASQVEREPHCQYLFCIPKYPTLVEEVRRRRRFRGTLYDGITATTRSAWRRHWPRRPPGRRVLGEALHDQATRGSVPKRESASGGYDVMEDLRLIKTVAADFRRMRMPGSDPVANGHRRHTQRARQAQKGTRQTCAASPGFSALETWMSPVGR